MREFLGTLALVFGAIIAWWLLAASYFKFDVQPTTAQQVLATPQAPEAPHVSVPPQQVIDFRHVSEIISAADHHVSILIAFVLVVIVLAWMNIRITRIHVDARRPAPPRYEPPRLENHREEYHGRLPAKRDDNPFTDWRK